MRRLVHQLALLAHHLHLSLAADILALVGGDGGVGVGVISLHAEVANVLDNIDLEAQVLGVAQVLRLIEGGAGVAGERGLDRILEIFIPKSSLEIHR